MQKRVAGNWPLVAVFFVSAGAFSSLSGATTAPPQLGGKWKILVKAEDQTRDYSLDLKQDGGKVSGLFVSPRSGEFPIRSGTFADGVLRIEVPRGELTFVIEAKWLEAGRFEGKLKINENEAGDVTITKEEPASPGKPGAGKSIAGKWNVVTKTQEGQEYASTIEVNQIEQGLAGRTRSQLGEFELKSLAFDGSVLTFDLVLPLGGNDVAFEVRAELKDPDHLAGRWKTKEADISGEWLAVREKPAVAPTAAAPASALSGAWYGVGNDGNEKKSFRIDLQFEGASLKGKVRSEGVEHEILGGKVDGNKLEFSIEIGDEKQKIAVQATLDGGTIRGRWTTPAGEGGEWMARKPERL